MKANGKIVKCMVRGNFVGQTAANMMDNTLMISRKDTDKCVGPTARHTAENGNRGSNKGAECTVINKVYGGKEIGEKENSLKNEMIF